MSDGVSNANNDAARRAAEAEARRAREAAQQQAQQAQQTQQVQQAQQSQLGDQPQPEALKGVDAAARTRDVVAAASVDNENAAGAAEKLKAAKTDKKDEPPALPAEAKPTSTAPARLTPDELKSFSEKPVPTDTAGLVKRGQEAAELASRSARDRQATAERPLDKKLGRAEMDLRRSEAGRLEEAAAKTTDPAQKAELTKTAEAIRQNLPTDPQSRAIIEGLAAGKPPASQLGQAEARLARDLLKDYPPVITGGNQSGRINANNDVINRNEQLDAAYKKNGWADDLPIRPGTPGADQAVIANAVDIGRAANPNGTPAAKDFKALSPQATDDTLAALGNFKKANPAVFGDPPPKDPEALKTREVINQTDAAVRRHADIQRLTQNVDNVTNAFQDLKDGRGVFGNTADGIKNVFGSEDGSRRVGEAVAGLDPIRAKADALYNHSGDDASFTSELGKVATEAGGAIKGVAERVERYGQSQKAWVDGLTTTAAATAAIAAAPFTGGVSLGGLAAAGAIGASVKVAGQGLEALTGNGRYESNPLTDALKGGLAGMTGPLASRIGGALTARLGFGVPGNAVGFGVAGAGDGFVNGAGGSLVDGNGFKQALKDGVDGAKFGALLGGGGAALGNVFRRLDVNPNTLGSNGGNFKLKPDADRAAAFRKDIEPKHIRPIEAQPAEIVGTQRKGFKVEQQLQVTDSAGNKIKFNNKEGKHQNAQISSDTAEQTAAKLKAALPPKADPVDAAKKIGGQFTKEFSTPEGQKRLIDEALRGRDLRTAIDGLEFTASKPIGAAVHPDTGKIAATSRFRLYGDQTGGYHLVPIP